MANNHNPEKFSSPLLPHSALKAGAEFEILGEKFVGLSLSGIRTALAYPQLELAFDIAQGLPFSLKMKKFFITHGHLDHAAGIPYLISQKAMHNEVTPPVYMPPTLVAPLTEIMHLWQKIEGHEYNLNFLPVEDGMEIPLNPQRFIKVFRTTHRIESFGYTLFCTNKKLKPEFINCSPKTLIQLKNSGQNIDNIESFPLFSFTGDTTIDFLSKNNWVTQSKILFIEVTYLDDRKSVEHSRKWGHIHIHELVDNLQLIQSEKIIIKHISSRYKNSEIPELITKKIPAKYLDRILVLPGR